LKKVLHYLSGARVRGKYTNIPKIDNGGFVTAVGKCKMKYFKYAIILITFLPFNAFGLECQKRGRCADSRLNQTYEIKKEVRRQSEETRRLIKRTQRINRINQSNEIILPKDSRARTRLLHETNKFILGSKQ